MDKTSIKPFKVPDALTSRQNRNNYEAFGHENTHCSLWTELLLKFLI